MDWFHGYLYSISAGQTWYDFGTYQRYLHAYFTSEGRVEITHEEGVADRYGLLPLTELDRLAKEKLSPSCRWGEGAPLTDSPCWPQAVR